MDSRLLGENLSATFDLFFLDNSSFPIIPWTTLTAIVVVLISMLLLLLSNHASGEFSPPIGCSPIGMLEQSNLKDEEDPRYLKPTDMNSWKVKSILLYPIKSCRGVELEQATVVSTGLQYDRQFSFAQLKSPFPLSASDSGDKKSAHEWKFITQREFPLLSQVKTSVWVPDPSKAGYKDDPFVKSGGAIIVTYPWQSDGWRGIVENLKAKIRGGNPEKSFAIPFNPTKEQLKDYTQERFTIWKETVIATNMSTYVPPELKYFLGVRNPMGLFRVFKEREVFRTAPRKEVLGYQSITGFADAFPLHLLGISSMQELSRTQKPGSPHLSVIRFRPNIVIEGPPPYEEEKWKRVDIGGQLYYIACRCVRCLIPNINPKTGQRHGSEPNRTLRATRNVDPGSPLNGCLGMNAVPGREEGKISVGDSIVVLEEGAHIYEPM